LIKRRICNAKERRKRSLDAEIGLQIEDGAGVEGEGRGAVDLSGCQHEGIGGRITYDGEQGFLRGLGLDDADDGSISHVAALGGTRALCRHDYGVLVAGRLRRRWRFASLLGAAVVLRFLYRRSRVAGVRHPHRATMSGSFACKQRSTEHANDREDHQERHDLSNARHASTETIMNVAWTNDGDVCHRRIVFY
jgi:hypothetical protein